MDKIDTSEFIEFKGNSDFFDFVIEPDTFDFKKFQSQWIVNANQQPKEFYKYLSKHKIACDKIEQLLIKSLNQNYSNMDKQLLEKTLANFIEITN